MENFKIKNFRKINPTIEFPAFKSLSSVEMEEIRKRLSQVIGETAFKKPLVEALNDFSVAVKGINAKDDDFLLERACESLNIHPRDKIYINWYRFDDIDEMHFTDFNNYFSDIWYPSSDDIDIFDTTFSWLLSVSHNGNIKLLRPKNYKD